MTATLKTTNDRIDGSKSEIEPVPYEIWSLALEKWETACHYDDPQKALSWWELKGTSWCSFCTFYRKNGACSECPLSSVEEERSENFCAQEWHAIRNAMFVLRELESTLSTAEWQLLAKNALAIFRANANALHARIRALPHTESEKA